MRRSANRTAAGPIARAPGAAPSKPWSFLAPPAAQRPLSDPTLGGFLGRPPPWADFAPRAFRAAAPQPAPAKSDAGAGLRVGAPDRPFEAEADRAADSMVAGGDGRRSSAPPTPAAASPHDAPAGGRLASRIAAVAGAGGDPVAPSLIAASRDVLGRSLDGVRVHHGPEVAPIARDLGARAFTLGRDVFVRGGDYAPATSAGRRLIAHELTHVAQQTRGQPVLQRQMAGPAPTASPARGTAPSSGPPVTAAALIEQYTSFFRNLDEDALGRDLAMRASRGEYEIVHQVMNELGSTDRDDVAFAFMKTLQPGPLMALEATTGGRQVLDRLLDELTSGSVSAEEQHEANRILAVKQLRIGPASFVEGALAPGAKIFPLRLGGITVPDQATLFASLRSRGMVHVSMPVAVAGTDEFAGDVRTLPSAVFTSGIDIPADEIVGVRMYDFDGKVRSMPAVQLLEVANRQDRETAKHGLELVAIAATLGSGALLGAGARGVSLGVRILAAADRMAGALGVITFLIQEHRGWIRQQFGRTGEEFLRVVDVVESAVAVFGLVRLATAAPRAIRAFRDAYGRWRSAADAIKGSLDEDRRAAIEKIIAQSEQMLKDADEIAAAGKAPGGRPAAPSEEVPGAAGGRTAAEPRQTPAAAAPAKAAPAKAAPAKTAPPPAPKRAPAEPAPAKGARAAEAPAKAGKELVTKPVPGLFAGVKLDPQQGPWRFDTHFSEVRLPNGGSRATVSTNVSLKAPNGLTYNGSVVRTVTVTPRPGGGHDVTLTMDAAFIDDIPKELRWVNEGGAPLVTGRGTPLQTYVTLMQLKSQGITLGSVTQAKMSTIVNARTVLELESLRRKNPGVAVNKLIEQTQSGIYGSTNLTQAGSTIKGLKVKGGGPLSVRDVISGTEMDSDAALKKLGLSRDDTVRLYSFDIEFELAPPGGSKP